jgi:hypothetical protein
VSDVTHASLRRLFPPRGIRPEVAHLEAAVPVVESNPSPRVPNGFVAPLRAVASDVNLCIAHSLKRDLGPINVRVRFTPRRDGAFVQGVEVSSIWGNRVVEDCIAEVFEETTFWPQPDGRFDPAEFIFHFPCDAAEGPLGMSLVR